MPIYPPKISERFFAAQNAGEILSADAVGAGASFVCGAAVRIFLQIEAGKITRATFQAAGCGFLVAAADVLCDKLAGEFVGQFFNAETQRRGEIKVFLAEKLEPFPTGRAHCVELVLEALTAAVNNFRAAETRGWQGDDALICTCFGVSESVIEAAIAENLLGTVEDVTRVARAGGGCGSCQPLIQEILDDVWRI